MILATIKKEMLLLTRDVHALAVLFFMPLAFILIMSFAMQDTYKQNNALKISGAIFADEQSPFSEQLSVYLYKIPYINWKKPENANLDNFKNAVRGNQLDFLLHISRITGSNNSNEPSHSIQLFLSPGVTPQTLVLIESAIKEGLGKNRLHSFLGQLNPSTDAEIEANIANIAEKDTVTSEYLYYDNANRVKPTSVQQSVPAWLVFAMFFVLIPMSSAMISEVQLGTLRRLRSMHMSSARFLIGKIVPFLIINQIQFIIMIAAGKFLMPLLGGESLVINGSIDGLLLMSLSTSLAAVGFALLISVIAKSHEQATALGGTFNIILAAIGGIMVPKFIMPASMQTFANISPMSWGLDGFLEVILYGGNAMKAFPYAATLTIFGIITIFIATLIFNRRINYNE
jgi:ABC-2 type transport system permease protein